MEQGASPLEGRRLADRYHLEQELASGGMGGLWLARDEVLGRLVAIKILHDHLASDEALLERFHLEAVAAARLSHPAVVRVFDTGIDDGVCYIVMELVEGRTVAELLRDRGALPPASVANIARGVLQALAHAHREGVIHRDVKPGNILVGDSDRVKLADFGIAKAAFVADDLTTTGNLLGTSRYVSPEQVTGGDVDGRSDLYALGVVMYELLTGRPPFEAESHIATATMRLTTDPPPPGTLRPGIPRGLETLVMKALARDPEERFQTAEDMRAALDHVIPSSEGPSEPLPPPAPVRQRSSRSWIAIPIVLVVIAGLAVGAFLLLEGFDSEAPARGAASVPRSQPLEVTQTYSYDPPPGGGEENDSTLGAAIDGDATSFWTTEGYASEDLGGAKDGVGLVLELENETTVGAVTIESDLPGWAFSVYAGSGSDVFDMETPVGGSSSVGENETYDLQPVETRYLLIWITRLADSQEGSYRFKAHVNEVEVLGV